jgi:hypothetical protein
MTNKSQYNSNFGLTFHALGQARIAICGYLAVAIVLLNISADRFYNLSHFHVSKAYFSAARGAMSGCIIAATSDFAMLYMLGLQPPPPEGYGAGPSSP